MVVQVVMEVCVNDKVVEVGKKELHILTYLHYLITHKHTPVSRSLLTGICGAREDRCVHEC